MKPGFSILEFIIGAMISTILITAAFTIYDTISSSTRKIQRITTEDTKMMVLYDRLQKDLTSLCPLWFTKQMYEKSKSQKESENQQTPDSQKQESKDSEFKENGFFYAQTNENNELKFFTFVTTSGMSIFGEDQNPCVRVVYALKKISQDEKIFSLLRKELHDISPEIKEEILFKEDTFYTLIDNMLSCKVDFMFIDMPNKEKKDKEIDLKTYQDWGVIKEKDDTNNQKPALPKYIKIRIKFANIQNKEPIEHTIICQTFVDPYNKLTAFAEKQKKNNNAPPATVKSEEDSKNNTLTNSQPDGAGNA